MMRPVWGSVRVPRRVSAVWIVAILGLGLLMIPPASAQEWRIPITSNWLSNPVTLDGQKGSGEWDDTPWQDVTLIQDRYGAYGPGSTPARIWFKNDGTWLYVLVRVEWPEAVDKEWHGLFIDYYWFYWHTHWDHSDGSGLIFNGTTLASYSTDAYGWDEVNWYDDVSAGGQNNTQGAVTHDGTNYWFEFRKALNSDDGYDWALQAGGTYGTDPTSLMIAFAGNGTEPYYATDNMLLHLSPDTWYGPNQNRPVSETWYRPEVPGYPGEFYPSRQQEPAVANNPVDPNNIIVAARDNEPPPESSVDWYFRDVGDPYGTGTQSRVHIYTTLDDGAHWFNQIAPNATDDGVRAASSVSLSFDHRGTAYLAFLAGREGWEGWLVAVTRSYDEGITWSSPATVVASPDYGYTSGCENCWDWKPRMAVDGSPSSPRAGNLYVVWVHKDESPGSPQNATKIRFARSTNGGESFDDPVDLAGPILYTSPRVIGFPTITVAPDGAIYVAYYDSLTDGGTGPGWNGYWGWGWTGKGSQGFGNFQIVVKKSVDGGVTWTTPGSPSPLAEAGFWWNYTKTFPGWWGVSLALPPTWFDATSTMMPVITAGPNGYVYIVTTAKGTVANSSNIVFLRSMNGGAAWSAPLTVNDDGSGRDHFFPSITVQKDNVIHVTFADRRNDPADIAYDIYYAVSTDLGASFSANQRVTDAQSDPRCGFIPPNQYGPPGQDEGAWIGGNFGLSSNDQYVTAVWTDTRSCAWSGQDVYVSSRYAGVQRIDLKAGWNLVSLPVIPSNPTIATVLSSLLAFSEVTSVWSYTGAPRAWQFFLPGKASTLSTMVDGNGYWIYMRMADTLYVGGYVIAPSSTPPSYSLVPGWNLVGFKPQPTVTDETVGAYLSSISGKYDTSNVWLYDNLGNTWIRATNSDVLYPGDAMWILMTTTTPATLLPQ
jgi:hypothetical protein